MELPFTVNGIKAYYANDASFDTGKIAESQAYVLDADGWNLYLRNNISESLNNVRVEAGMPRLKAMCNLRSEKIPYALIRKVGKFFTEVYKLHKSEAVGYLYYSPTLGWLFWPPEQTATTAHCKYGEPAAIDGYQVAGTIHSHGSMSAFHSGTDKDDEANFDGIHITIGKVDEVRYELALSVVCGGVRYKVAEEQLISGFGDTMVPSEWLEAVKQPAVAQPLPATFMRVGDSPFGPELNAQVPYTHISTSAEWDKLSKEQKRAIKKAQKKQDDEGSGLLGFFDRHRFGGFV
jgi:hypothetical protein